MQQHLAPPQTNRVRPTERRILVCLDRSALSENCVPYAVLMAKAFGAQITLLHVMEAPSEQDAVHGQDALAWEISRREARSYLESVEQRLSRTLEQPVDIWLDQGHPAERIADIARDMRADLTVIGRGGEGGARDAHLGATALRVLTLARTSVFVVQSTDVSPWKSLKRIMVPLDGSARTESAIPAAVRIARVSGAELLLVHVVREPQPTSLLLGDDMEAARELARHFERNARSYLTDLRSGLIHKVPNVRTLVTRHVNERRGLLDVAAQEQADLVVLSAHGSACDIARSFGSVATYLLSYSMVPMLALQDVPEHLLTQSEQPDSTPESLRASFARERT